MKKAKYSLNQIRELFVSKAISSNSKFSYTIPDEEYNFNIHGYFVTSIISFNDIYNEIQREWLDKDGNHRALYHIDEDELDNEPIYTFIEGRFRTKKERNICEYSLNVNVYGTLPEIINTLKEYIVEINKAKKRKPQDVCIALSFEWCKDDDDEILELTSDIEIGDDF